jgi:hypothetical protein
MNETSGGVLMRLRTPSRGLALSAALLLTLTACNGGSPEEEGSVSPTTTAPASATDGGSSEGSESEGSETAEPSGSESGDAESTEGGGEYVPASADGPAQNVPKPQMPEAMKEETEEGAKAAVQYWWDTMYYLQLTGNPGPANEIAHRDCLFCESYAYDMVSLYEEGAWHTGTRATVESIMAHKPNPQTLMTIVVDMEMGNRFNQDGTIPEGGNIPASNDDPWKIRLTYDTREGHWLVTEASYVGGE